MAITTKNTGMKLEFIPETTRGTPVSSRSLRRPSDAITNVNLSGLNNGQIVFNINDYDGQDIVYGLKEYKLSFEYDLQRTRGSGAYSLTRTIHGIAANRTSGLLTPLTFYLHTQSNATLECRGCVVDTWKMDVAPGGRLHCTADISVASVKWTTGSYGSLTASSALGTTFETFQGALITRTGGFDEGVSNFSVTIKNNSKGVPNIGKQVYKYIYESTQNIDGTADVILYSGGKTDWEEMAGASGNGAPTEQDIVFSSGNSTTATDKSIKWTFSPAAYTNLPVNFKPEDGWVTSGMTWIAQAVTIADYS